MRGCNVDTKIPCTQLTINFMWNRAAMDMATETHFLSVLDHPHIIKMRAVGEIDMFDKNYFIVLDRLYDTLDERIDDWKEELLRSTSCMAMFRRPSRW